MPYTQQHVVSQGETPASSSYFNAEMTYIYNAINAEAANIAAHVADTEDAHDASAISVADTGGNFTGTNVEAVLAELHVDITAHVNDTSAAHAASAISVADSGGNFTATDVEAALAELTSASTINITDTGELITATNVEAALAELATDIAANPVVAHAGYDATEYSKTGDTDYTLKKTFTFTPAAASFGRLVYSVALKGSVTNTAYARFDIDDVATDFLDSKTGSYVTKTNSSTGIRPFTAEAHTVKVYLKSEKTDETAYAKDIYFAYIGVKTA